MATAKASFEAADSSLRDLKNDLERQTSDLATDYGPDGVFRALKGQCIAKDSGEYSYELCWLDRTKQRSKKGGGETNMGNHVGFEMILVNDELPADGRGLGTGERLAIRHENGQGCWNGPSRSTLVVLACAEKDEIWKITEEEKCVYRMEVGSPAVCELNKRTGDEKAEKDEL